MGAQLLNTSLSAIKGGAAAAALPSISGHAPVSGPAGTTVVVAGTHLPTSGWGTSWWLVLDDGLGVNTVNRSMNVTPGSSNSFAFTIGGIPPGSSRSVVRITNVSPIAGSVTTSPTGGISVDP